MSKGIEELLDIIGQIYPNQKIELEYNVADKGGLFIDIYLPALKLGFEFDGIQHFQFVEHFHGDAKGFIRARRRDSEKNEMCQQKGIALVRVAYNEPMTKENILSKIEVALDE